MGNYSRSTGNRPYKKLFLLSTEGTNTEPQYFARFNSYYVRVNCLHKGRTTPREVLAELKRGIGQFRLHEGDQAWMVIDRDEWDEAQIDACKAWVGDPGESPLLAKGLALSNPKFEFWLLLHFENGTEHATSRACVEALKTHLPDYDKNLKPADITAENVTAAIAHAKALWGDGDVTVWPREKGKTNVFHLVETLQRVTEEEKAKFYSELAH